MVRTYKYDDDTQLSEHFNVRDFRCKCGTNHDILIADELWQKGELLMSALHCTKKRISSGFRCSNHDKSVGGKGTGKHTQGLAFDICFFEDNGTPISSKIVCCKAQDIGFGGIANINASYQYTHLDVRTGSKWYGNEIYGNNNVTTDFYEYYGIKGDGTDMSTLKKGIDISYCQPKVDWDKVDVDFAILRAGYGKYAKQKDTMFESHYAGAKSRGIPVGAYWYSYAMTEDEARQEADACLAVIKGKQFEYPIYYDVEEKKQFDLGREKVSAIIRAFLERLEAAGYWVGLYGSYSSLTTFTDEDIRKRYAIWLAHWGVTKSPYSGAYGIWQYNVGKIAGIDGDCDLDYGYVDYPSQIKSKGLNGFGEPPAPKDPSDQPSQDDKPDDPVPAKTIYVEMDLDGQTYAGTLTAK